VHVYRYKEAPKDVSQMPWRLALTVTDALFISKVTNLASVACLLMTYEGACIAHK
jgi:hypothetical protein